MGVVWGSTVCVGSMLGPPFSATELLSRSPAFVHPDPAGRAVDSKPRAGTVEKLALLAQLLGLVLLVRQVRLWWDEGQEKRKARSCARGEL